MAAIKSVTVYLRGN